MTFHIDQAAKLISEIDPSLAAAFRRPAANRPLMIEAFRASLKNSALAALADELCGSLVARVEMHAELTGARS